MSTKALCFVYIFWFVCLYFLFVCFVLNHRRSHHSWQGLGSPARLQRLLLIRCAGEQRQRWSGDPPREPGACHCGVDPPESLWAEERLTVGGGGGCHWTGVPPHSTLLSSFHLPHGPKTGVIQSRLNLLVYWRRDDTSLTNGDWHEVFVSLRQLERKSCFCCSKKYARCCCHGVSPDYDVAISHTVNYCFKRKEKNTNLKVLNTALTQSDEWRGDCSDLPLLIFYLIHWPARSHCIPIVQTTPGHFTTDHWLFKKHPFQKWCLCSCLFLWLPVFGPLLCPCTQAETYVWICTLWSFLLRSLISIKTAMRE